MLGKKHSQDRPRQRRIILVWIVGFSLLLTACDTAHPPKPFTIGVVSYVSIHAPVIEGFKAGMVESGYIEGDTMSQLIKNLIAEDIGCGSKE
jgi:hypothetical protein